MNPFRLDIDRRVKRQLRIAPARVQAEIAQILLDLRLDPYPPESTPLRREYANLRKIRVDGWRVLYKVFGAARAVRILAVKPRDADTYRSLFQFTPHPVTLPACSGVPGRR